jgi:hypothetical protein
MSATSFHSRTNNRRLFDHRVQARGALHPKSCFTASYRARHDSFVDAVSPATRSKDTWRRGQLRTALQTNLQTVLRIVFRFCDDVWKVSRTKPIHHL